jgi:hypothetical protein
MGHFAGAVSSSEISWNKIVNADNSSLVFSDGTAAAGISLTVGRSDAGVSNVVDYNSKNITSSALGGSELQGIYTNTSPTKDGIFATGTATVNTNAVGIRINGLAAGTYTLYLGGRNTSTAVTAPMQFFVSHGASSASFSFSSAPSSVEQNSASAPGTLPNAALAIQNTFAYGDNCTHLVVTLGAGESLYLASIGTFTNEFRGFLNAVEIMPGQPVLTNFPPTIGVQPGNATAYAGATVSFANVKYGGVPPLTYQWYFDNSPISGQTNSALTLANVSTAAAGTYNVVVSNVVSSQTSSNAVLSVIPLFDTGQMSNIWNILPGDTNHPYITTTAGGERSLAYDSNTQDLLVLTHVPTNNLVVLDPATGNQKYFMNVSGIFTNAGGINTVGVADDGTVYSGNVIAAANSSTPYNLWQWSSDSASAGALELFADDPTLGAFPNLRWGDAMAVRGSGATTQILIAAGAETNGYGTNVVIFTTPDALNFTPQVIGISGVPSGFGQGGVAFGPGANTFWAKNKGSELYLVQFDLNTLTGSVLYAFGTNNNVPDTFQFINVNSSQKWLGGIMSVASGLPDNVRLYDISNLTNGPALADQVTNLTATQNSFNNGVGVGSTAFGGNYLFALDSQNGLRAFLISTNASLPPFSITSFQAQAGPALVLTWPSIAGHSYQVQYKTNLTDAVWSAAGSPVTAVGTATSATNSVPGTVFYRVQGK